MLPSNDLETQQSGYVYVVRDGAVMYESDPIPNITGDELNPDSACSIFGSFALVGFLSTSTILMFTKNRDELIIGIVLWSILIFFVICAHCCVCQCVRHARRALKAGENWMIQTNSYAFVCTDSGDPICVQVQLLGAKRIAAMHRASTKDKNPHRSFEYSRMHILKDLR